MAPTPTATGTPTATVMTVLACRTIDGTDTPKNWTQEVVLGNSNKSDKHDLLTKQFLSKKSVVKPASFDLNGYEPNKTVHEHNSTTDVIVESTGYAQINLVKADETLILPSDSLKQIDCVTDEAV